MPKNALIDLTDHLFESIEWITDRDLKGQELTDQIRRNDALCKASTQIVATAKLLLDAQKAKDNAMGKMKLPAMLEDKS